MSHLNGCWSRPGWIWPTLGGGKSRSAWAGKHHTKYFWTWILPPPHPRGVRSGCLWHGVGGPCLKVQADPDNTITPKYSEYDAFCQMGAMFWQRRGATRVCVCWTLLFSKNNWPQSLVVTAESACLWLWHWPTCWRRRCQSEIGGMLHHAAVRGRMPNRVPDLSCQKAPHWNSVQRHIVWTMGKLETLKNKCFL